MGWWVYSFRILDYIPVGVRTPITQPSITIPLAMFPVSHTDPVQTSRDAWLPIAPI